MEHPADIFLPTRERIEQFIARLPTLPKKDVPLEESCPICLVSFQDICGRSDSDRVADAADSRQLRGVTMLAGCGHIFCRTDLVQWIHGRHGTCPACRHTFLAIVPLDSDNESSDGDYVPGDEEEDEDDGFLDTDGFTDPDAEFDVDANMDLGFVAVPGMEYPDIFGTDDEFEDADENMEVEGEDVDPTNWGLTYEDGGSDSLSEDDLFGDRFLPQDDAGVYEEESYMSAPEGDDADDAK